MLVPGNTLCFRWQKIALKERKQPQSVCELKDVLWETGMKTIREATSTRLYGFIASSGALTAECVYIQEGAIYTRHTHNVCRSGSCVSLSPRRSYWHTCTHTPLSSPPPSHQPSIFFPPSTPWHPAVGRDIREKQSERRREKRKGVRGRNTTGKKGIESVEARGSYLKKGLGGASLEKKDWEGASGGVRSKWGACEWFPQCHEATWERLQPRVKERWSKLDGLHIRWEEPVPLKERAQ